MTRLILGAALVLQAGLAGAELPPAGESRIFESPNGVLERCVRPARAPDAAYPESDTRLEARLCAVDLYAPDVGLCPKIWSTSPATIVHRVSGSPAEFERKACVEGTRARRLAAEELAVFKMSMNERDTSATFAPAALLYYHFARWFDAAVRVPPAVYRSMDREIHLQRVVRPGLALTEGRDPLAMIHAGWMHFAERHEAAGRGALGYDLYEPGGNVYGVFILESGRRYGPEMNGTRASGWGRGQNEDFQRTAPFLALRSPGSLGEAAAAGLEAARRDPEMAAALGDVSLVQVVFWMRELADIVLLDFIFSQQDRIGNIDYDVWWVWTGPDGAQRFAPGGRAPPDDSIEAVRIRRSILNDNDAAGRLPYANYAKQTGMLEGWRHFPAATYRRLMQLDREFAGSGPALTWLEQAFPLTRRQRQMIVRNTAMAAAILRKTCQSGALRFDLDPEAFLAGGEIVPDDVSCDG